MLPAAPRILSLTVAIPATLPIITEILSATLLTTSTKIMIISTIIMITSARFMTTSNILLIVFVNLPDYRGKCSDHCWRAPGHHRRFVSDETCFRIGRYEHPRRTIRVADDGLCVAISAPGAAPCASLCSGDKQQSMGNGRDGGHFALRSHGGGGGAAQTFLPVLFLQLQPRHCPFALRHGNGGEAENHVHFALEPPRKPQKSHFF